MLIEDLAKDSCLICKGHYKHKLRESVGLHGLTEVNLDLMHNKCYNTVMKLEKAKRKVLDLEWELFSKKDIENSRDIPYTEQEDV